MVYIYDDRWTLRPILLWSLRLRWCIQWKATIVMVPCIFCVLWFFFCFNSKNHWCFLLINLIHLMHPIQSVIWPSPFPKAPYGVLWFYFCFDSKNYRYVILLNSGLMYTYPTNNISVNLSPRFHINQWLYPLINRLSNSFLSKPSVPHLP